MITWDARDWLARLVGCPASELAVHSRDAYSGETQVRYQRGGEVVARMIVSGPITPMGESSGHWLVSVRIGSGSDDVHEITVPAGATITYE
jgi:hypothetical protein